MCDEEEEEKEGRLSRQSFRLCESLGQPMRRGDAAQRLSVGQKWLRLVSTPAVHIHGWEAAWSLLFCLLYSIYRKSIGKLSVLLGLIFAWSFLFIIYLLCLSPAEIHPLTQSTLLASTMGFFSLLISINNCST